MCGKTPYGTTFIYSVFIFYVSICGRNMDWEPWAHYDWSDGCIVANAKGLHGETGQATKHLEHSFLFLSVRVPMVLCCREVLMGEKSWHRIHVWTNVLETLASFPVQPWPALLCAAVKAGGVVLRHSLHITSNCPLSATPCP
jgi:hypothetical protein